MVVPDSVMLWISVLIPLLSFLAGYGLQMWVKRAWVGTIVVLGGSFAVLILWFRLSFWPWVLMYVMLDWLGAWASVNVTKWRRANTSKRERKAIQR